MMTKRGMPAVIWSPHHSCAHTISTDTGVPVVSWTDQREGSKRRAVVFRRVVRGCGFSIVTCRLMHAAHSDIPRSDICSPGDLPLQKMPSRTSVPSVTVIAYSYTVGVWATAVIDRRLRPRCCHLGSYFKRPKSSSVRPFACNWCYCAQVIAKPKAALCAALQLGGDVEQPCLLRKRDVIHKTVRGGQSHGHS